MNSEFLGVMQELKTEGKWSAKATAIDCVYVIILLPSSVLVTD